MYIDVWYYVHMIKRTTIEIDEDLLERAKQALGESTTRATVEEALRRAADSAEDERVGRAERQRQFFEELDTHLDLEVLKSDEMWR
jgi:Arc/MetJ family transcription regulator